MTDHVLVAPDKFKGSLSAAEVAAWVAAGLARAGFGGEAVRLPVADGGDGTVDAAVAAGYRRIDFEVRGPVGRPVTASFGMLDGTAVIEAAQAVRAYLAAGGFAGAADGDQSRRGRAHRGRGAGLGADRVVLGIGGVATTDGGAGLVQALGARLTDDCGRELAPGGAALTGLGKLDVARMRDLSEVEFLVASDVDNPLLGPHGAAAVYAPQKGASPSDVQVLETGLARWADVAEEAHGRTARHSARAGAAGGLGFAALLFLGARVRPGISLLLDMLSFGARLDGARLVITGEGALDEQTLHGKAPLGVASAAAAHSRAVPVVAVAGVCTLSPAQLRAAGIAAAYAIADIEPDRARCMADAGPLWSGSPS